MIRVLLGLVMFCAVARAQTPSPLPPMPPRPGGETAPTRVSYATWIGDITQIDSVAQTFSASVVVMVRWHDPQLAHAGPGAKRFALDDIWHPRLLIVNEASSADLTLPEAADVAPDGTAVYRQRVVGTFAQALNLRAFPFDYDTFRVRFIALGHRPEEIEFVLDEKAVAAGLRDGVGLAQPLTLQDWQVTGATTRVQSSQNTPSVELPGCAV
jgi:hypothetical protein